MEMEPNGKIERNGNRIKWTWKNGKCNEMETEMERNGNGTGKK